MVRNGLRACVECAEPVVAIVVDLVGKAHGDAVADEGWQLLDQPVVEFTDPPAGEERLDGFAAGEKSSPVAAFAVRV